MNVPEVLFSAWVYKKHLVGSPQTLVAFSFCDLFHPLVVLYYFYKSNFWAVASVFGIVSSFEAIRRLRIEDDLSPLKHIGHVHILLVIVLVSDGIKGWGCNLVV